MPDYYCIRESKKLSLKDLFSSLTFPCLLVFVLLMSLNIEF